VGDWVWKVGGGSQGWKRNLAGCSLRAVGVGGPGQHLKSFKKIANMVRGRGGQRDFHARGSYGLSQSLTSKRASLVSLRWTRGALGWESGKSDRGCVEE